MDLTLRGQMYVLFLISALISHSLQDQNSTHPELEFQPFLSKYDGVIWVEDARQSHFDGTISVYNNQKPYLPLTDAIDNYLKSYRQISNYHETITSCEGNSRPPKGKFCAFDVQSLKQCNQERLYGYPYYTPCIILALKKVPGWIPQYHNSSTLTSEMPGFIKNNIIEAENRKESEVVWVSCKGRTAADAENIGPVAYYPMPGFPGNYFPFDNVTGYQSPLVAVQLLKPRVGVLINMMCTAWAQNIAHDHQKNLGTVSIDLLLD